MIKTGLLSAGIAAAVIAFSGGTAMAADAAKGEKVAKKCVACHTFESGGANKVGPNLFGTIGRTVGSVDGFGYSDSYVTLGEGGMAWDEENLAAYLQDPKGWVREATGDKKAKSKMSFKLRKEADVADVIAYMATLK